MPRHRLSRFVSMLFLALSACSDPTRVADPAQPPNAVLAKATSNPTVTSVVPDAVPRGTTVDVQVSGSGFDRGTKVRFTLDGLDDARVKVNSTKYARSTQLVANVTVAGDADVDLYDAVVTTSSGKTGIGTEMLEIVLAAEVLGGGTRAQAVNSSETTAGTGPNNASCDYSSAVLWNSDGSSMPLPLGTNCGGSAKHLNAAGTILGVVFVGEYGSDGALWRLVDGAYTLQPFPRTADGYRPITDVINDADEMAGWGQRGAELFWWSQATGWLSVAVPPGATSCQLYDGLNNLGELAATCTINGVREGFYWPDHSSAPIALPRPAGASEAIPHDISNTGVIVGYGGGKALRWTPSPTGYIAEVLGDDGYGAAAYSVADDGTVVGSVKRVSSGTGSVPAYWPQGASTFRNLELPRSANGGDALDVVSVSGRVVIVGSCAGIAVRWRTDPALF